MVRLAVHIDSIQHLDLLPGLMLVFYVLDAFSATSDSPTVSDRPLQFDLSVVIGDGSPIGIIVMVLQVTFMTISRLRTLILSH